MLKLVLALACTAVPTPPPPSPPCSSSHNYGYGYHYKGRPRTTKKPKLENPNIAAADLVSVQGPGSVGFWFEEFLIFHEGLGVYRASGLWGFPGSTGPTCNPQSSS